ncbi:hypothetical protein K2173_001952 [Erythroxylum novogranatense]|uniref:Uncharacterized protein n=1 Tax=Erythroxylum novogranatense TaxID=1862640 RepID=A0AAV8SPX5_9ROSI|nr:hypothetical protein K2173_001952 [Erythroxylum novogranatense]
MSRSFLTSLRMRWPLLLYAATWTALLTVIVAVASFAPEFAFVSAISSSSSSASEGCSQGSIRVPIDVPSEVTCLPAHLFTRSGIDVIVPPVFAAAVVVGSAWVVRAAGFWEHDQAR